MWFLCPKRGVIRVWCSVLQNFANCSFLFSFLDRVQRLVTSFVFCESWARQTKRSSILYLSCWIKLFSSCFDNWAWTQIDFYFSISLSLFHISFHVSFFLFAHSETNLQEVGTVLYYSSVVMMERSWQDLWAYWSCPLVSCLTSCGGGGKEVSSAQMHISSQELRSGQPYGSLPRHWDLGASFLSWEPCVAVI